jgi:hypothetical protein
MSHLDMKTLLTLAMRGETSSHFEVCSFCREQYQLAVEFLSFSPDHVQENELASAAAIAKSPPAYRLAAQTSDVVSPMFRLRRTWYFDRYGSILRVIEDTQRQVLTGFFISDRQYSDCLRIRFDGIDEEFRPDVNGVFEIGPAGINIEPMQVTVINS